MAAGMSKLLIWPLVAGLAVMALLVFWRGFFWQHAAIIGLAVAALVYTGRRTLQNLRDLYRRQ
jgi:hypothetical protein